MGFLLSQANCPETTLQTEVSFVFTQPSTEEQLQPGRRAPPGTGMAHVSGNSRRGWNSQHHQFRKHCIERSQSSFKYWKWGFHEIVTSLLQFHGPHPSNNYTLFSGKYNVTNSLAFAKWVPFMDSRECFTMCTLLKVKRLPLQSSLGCNFLSTVACSRTYNEESKSDI